MKLERGGLHAEKIGGADAFGFYERTPSLPYAINEDPGSSFIPSSMDGVRRGSGWIPVFAGTTTFT